MQRVCVVGLGYVGLVTAAGMAELGYQVTGLDIDHDRVQRLRDGIMPIFEPGLADLVRATAERGSLRFTSSYEDAIPGADFVFVAVPTPPGPGGAADLSFVRTATQTIARHVHGDTIIVNKSTVPIGTGDLVATLVERHRLNGDQIAVVSNPEFLREGSAVEDFFHPDRIVLGCAEPAAARRVAELYVPLNCPTIITDLRTAEMIKYAANAFLATKISFINEIAGICDQLGADVTVVARGMGLDQRIGAAFLNAGIGYGGSCFPKDVQALEHMAAVHGCHPQLLRAVMEINRDQRLALVQNLRRLLGSLEGRRIGILGLAFKPNTDDMRGAPAVELAHLLTLEGCHLTAYDPVAMPVAKVMLPGLRLCDDPYQVAENSDALLLVTDWDEFRELDLQRIRRAMRTPIFLDGRNIFDPERMEREGFAYYGIGRGYRPHGWGDRTGALDRVESLLQ